MAKKKNEPDPSKLDKNLSFGKSKNQPSDSEGEKKVNQTFSIRRKYLKTLRRAAYWDRDTQVGIIEKALEAYFANKNYEPVLGEED